MTFRVGVTPDFQTDAKGLLEPALAEVLRGFEWEFLPHAGETAQREVLDQYDAVIALALFVVGYFETDGGAYPVLDRQCELLARVIRARREGRAAPFERRLAGPPPDFSAGVRYLDVERMRNYVRTHPYLRYLERAAGELAGL